MKEFQKLHHLETTGGDDSIISFVAFWLTLIALKTNNVAKENQRARINDYVWSYWNEGFSIIPLKANDKRPNIKSWEQYQAIPPTQEEIQKWLDDDLFHNIGIICGAVSNDLVVIDIDDEKVIDEIGIKINKLFDQGQWAVKTGKGYHIYCRHESNPGDLKKDNETHLEYRSNGGYVVAPPSIHPNGSQYRFLNDTHPSQLLSLEIINAENFYKNLVDKIRKIYGISSKVIEKPQDMDGIDADCIKNIFKGGLKENTIRNDTAFVLTNYYKHVKNLNPTEIKTLVGNWNKRNDPPLSTIELNNVINSALKSDKKTGCKRITELGYCPFKTQEECPFYKPVEQGIKELFKKYKVYTFKKIILEDETEKWIPDKIINPNLGELIFNEYNYHFITIDDASREILYYKDGVYLKNADTVILNITQHLMGEKTTVHGKNEVLNYIRDKRYVSRDIFINDPHLINVNNGIYDIKKKKLLPHSPDIYFITKLPVDYNPKADYAFFEKWIQHICMNQLQRRTDVEKTIQEYMGYSLYRAYSFKYYIVLDGSGDNAKTTLLNVVKFLIGKKNNTGVSLQELNDRPFSKQKLYGKHTNISDDLPNRGMKYSGAIKQITGNSPIWADIKNHKDGIEFTSYAKPWYTCNELPEVKDYSDAFFSRQLQITLLNKYVKPEDFDKVDNVSVFKADINIIEEFNQPEKLSAILNYAIKGLEELLENKSFSLQQTTEEKRETWLKKSNPVHALISEEYEYGDLDWCITVDDFADDVIAYCERMGFDKPSRHAITTRLNNEGIGIRKAQKTINGVSRTWVWLGLRSTVNSDINHYLGTKQQEIIA